VQARSGFAFGNAVSVCSDCYFLLVSNVTSTPQDDAREIARSIYRPFIDRLDFNEHRTLSKDMEALVATPGWSHLIDVIGGDVLAAGEMIVLTGEFDVRAAGVAAGCDRVLSFPQFVIDTFIERNRMEAAAQENKET
jgi:hypothetical protein